MKKIITLLVSMFMLVALVGCSTKPKEENPTASTPSEGTAETIKVALLLNGTLGDKSFFDSAANGMKLVNEEVKGVETKTIEMTYDDTKWEPAVLDAIEEGNDIIIVGTWQMQEIITRIAPQYPDVKFILFDTSVDNSSGDYDNTYSISYKQSDASYLAGALAATISETGKIGFVGGMDNTVIYDFLVGYVQGAKSVNPDIKVASAFVGNFSDSARAKELATSQYNMGVDIIFSVASTAGDGTMQAAKDLNKLAIGVDSDQAVLYGETDEAMANLIPTSVLKNVDVSLLHAIQAVVDGSIKWGTTVSVGLSENSVGLADNEYYQKNVDEAIRKEIEAIDAKIKNGEITVKSAFDMTTEEITELIDSVK